MTTFDAIGIQRLLPRHFTIIDMHVAGHSNVAIAETLNVSTRMVTALLRSPLAMAEIRRRMTGQSDIAITEDAAALRGKAKSLLDTSSVKAAETLTGLLNDEDSAIVLRAANSILDRAGIGANESKALAGQNQVTVNIGQADVSLLLLALKESRYASPTYPTHETPARIDQANGTPVDVCQDSISSSCGNGCRSSTDEASGLEELEAESRAFDLSNFETSTGLVESPQP